MDKRLELQKLKKEMENDKNLPLVSKPEDIIPGYGNPESKIVFIGEAGGYYELVQRKPFVGAAGQLLTRLLTSVGINREDVYITNMVKTRPPNNRDPLPEELAAYGRYLDRELEIINPKIIVTLGRFSMAKFLPSVKISAVHGRVCGVRWNGKDIVVVPMFHPAAALRAGDVMSMIKEDFAKLPEILKEMEKEKEKESAEQMCLV